MPVVAVQALLRAQLEDAAARHEILAGLTPVGGRPQLRVDAAQALFAVRQRVADGQLEPLTEPAMRAVIEDGFDLVSALSEAGTISGLLPALLAVREERCRSRGLERA